MAIFRLNKNENYTVMSNYHFKERKMSLKAKGLLSLMLSLPSDWDYSIAGLVAICKENETSVKTALNELKEFGYLRITKIMPTKDNGGRIDYIYDIFEKPKQEGKKQGLENLGVEKQGLENQCQLNTNKLNTNYNNIIAYLNDKAGTSYRSTTNKTQSLIRARINEKFTEEDFYKVIDKKVDEWKGTEFEKYLRPETLFGNKFESYLNSKINNKKSDANFKQRTYTKSELSNLYSDLDEINL